MFDTGFMELLLCFVIGLLILGPERLPRVAAQLGRWVGKARRTANQLRWQLEREVALDDVYRAQRKKKPQQSGTSAPGEKGSGEKGDAEGAAAQEAGETNGEPQIGGETPARSGPSVNTATTQDEPAVPDELPASSEAEPRGEPAAVTEAAGDDAAHASSSTK